MEFQRVNTRQVSVLDEAAQIADFIAKGNDLLNRAKEAARRIEERCLNAMRTNPDNWERSSSRPA
jgi:hypothetical protein